jgi:hypothetical protein
MHLPDFMASALYANAMASHTALYVNAMLMYDRAMPANRAVENDAPRASSRARISPQAFGANPTGVERRYAPVKAIVLIGARAFDFPLHGRGTMRKETAVAERPLM